MAIWHLMMGFGIGLVATLLTVIANQQQHRQITHKSNFFSPPGEQCVICLDNMTNDEMVYMNCGHAFHEECLKRLRKHQDNKCPICRKKI